MKYKTIIQITTEATDKSEAMEIVGDYLSGNIMSGVEMKCRTTPRIDYKGGILLGIALFSFVILGGALFTSTIGGSSFGTSNLAVASAMQPPLKTSLIASKNDSFKEDWQNKQTKEALHLNYLSKNK